MRSVLLLIIALGITVSCFAQAGTITGKVVNKSSHNPLPKASVFLSNATFGTVSNEDGTFTLSGVRPGQYDLVVSMVGYEDFVKTILVGKDPIKIDVELEQKVTELREVVVTNGGNWKLNYANFIKDFIGISDDGKKCKILNPTDLVLINHKTKRYLEGHSYDFLDIENRALGYKLKILLKDFKSDNLNHVIYWQGKVLFQELPGTEEQKKKWESRRREIYYGSSMHFFRSLLTNSLDTAGYVIRILRRRPNPYRANEAVIQQKLDKFANGRIDSLRYWETQYNMPRYQENLIREPLKVQDVVRKTDQPGLFAITFPECLYVTYTKRLEKFDFKDLYRPLDMPNYETSVISLYEPYALFDLNGVIVSGHSTLLEGTWSLSKVAELLPVDYAPADSKSVIN